MIDENVSLLPAVHPTMERCNLVRHSVVLTFSEVYKHMSLLKGRSIYDYCIQENAPGYIKHVFSVEENDMVQTSIAPEHLNLKVLYKLVRYVCGLAPREDDTWHNKDSLEFLINSAWEQMETLNEAAALTDQCLNHRLDILQQCLSKILDKVQEMKQVDVETVRREVLKNSTMTPVGPCANASSSSDIPYMYKILTQHIIHRIFVMVFKQLNCLNEKSIYDYLKEDTNIRRPMVCFTRREKDILKNKSFQPENVSIHLLYKLLPRVCDLSSHKEWPTSQNTIEYCLFCIKQEHDCAAFLDVQKFANNSHKLYRYLDRILSMIAEKHNKTKQDILREMPDEPVCMDDSFQFCDVLFSRISQQAVFLTQTSQELSFSPTAKEPGPSFRAHQEPGPSHTPQEPDIFHTCQAPTPSTPEKQLLPSQTPYSFNSVTPEEANVVHLFKALCPGGVAAKVMCEVYFALSGDIGKVNKKSFTAIELNQVKGDIRELDITTLYKLLRFACDLAAPGDAIWITQGDTLEYCLNSVKTMRNELAHKIICISNEDLKSKIQNLECLLESILLKASSLSKKDLKDKIDNMKNEIQPLAEPPPFLLDKENYLTKIKILQETLASQMAHDAEKELLNQYSLDAFTNISPVTWSYTDQHRNMTIDKLFTDLEIVDAVDVKIGNTFSLKERVFPVLLEQSEEIGSRVIIVQGVAGAGKTSLCKFLIHLWTTCQKHVSQKSVDLLIYIQCRYVTTSSISSYLKTILPKTFRCIDMDDIIPLMQESRVTFLVDGYDEARTEAKDLLDDILKFLPESKMIITSRPQWVPKLKSKVNQISSSCMKVLSLTGFKNDKRNEFIQKLFDVTLGVNQQQRCNQFFAYLNKLGEQLEVLTQLPLTLTLLVMLWIDDCKNAMEAKTITQLYRKLIEFMLKRLSSKLNISDHEQCREWMLTLGEIAWANLKKNQHYLDKRNVTKLKRKADSLHVDGMAAISTFLHCDIQISLTDSHEFWTFAHNCQQEFLAAEFIVEDVIVNDKSLRDILGFHGGDGEDKKLQRLIPVIEFITGLLSQENEITKERASEIIQIALVQTPWSFIAMSRIVQDMLETNVEAKEILKNMFKGQTLSDFLDGYDPQSVKWVLENTSLGIPSCIRLRNSVTAVLKMEPLLQLLNKKSCHPEIIISIDYVKSTEKAIEFVRNLKEPLGTFILLTWNSHSLIELIKNWPWDQSLHLSFPYEVFPLLWWELVICLTKQNIAVNTLIYSSRNQDCEKLIEEGAKSLHLTCKTDESLDAGDIIISC